MTTTFRRRTALGWMLVALVAAWGLAAAPAWAHANNNHGTIKVHDDLGTDPPQQNNPHVSCDFFIVGTNMSGDSGTIQFESIPPTTNPPVVTLVVSWSADSGSLEDGFDFTEGPFNFTEGHYRVEVFVDEGGPPGNQDHSAKSKVFWVDPCGVPPPPPPDCPDDLTAEALDGGDVFLDWNAVADADSYNVYRREAGDDGFDFVASTTDTSFTDSDVTPGVTYEYMVTAVVDGVESEDCDIIQVTPIPFFTNALAVGLAVAGGVGAFALLRSRRN